MKLHYYRETDSLYIDLKNKPSVDSKEVADGVVIDLDAKGNIVGIDIDHASKRLDITKFEAVAFPMARAKALKSVAGKSVAAKAGSKAG